MYRVGVVNLPGSNPTGMVAAFNRIGIASLVLSQPAEAQNVERIVVPGVGNFGPGADFLHSSGFADVLLQRVAEGGPVLGVCLGFHLFCKDSEEAPTHRGLGLIDAHVKKLRASEDRKVPHMGWAQITGPQDGQIPGLHEGSLFYFAHSFEVVFSAPQGSVYTATYGDSELVTAFRQGSFVGVQFHPEKSNESGLQLLKDFAS